MTMAKTPTHKVPFRRRRDNLTNYRKRLAMVKSGKTRMVIRKSNKGILVQFVKYDANGDRTILTVNGKTLLKKYGWESKRNVYTSYLVGLCIGKLAGKKGEKEFIVDLGLQKASKGSILFAAVKGAVDAGLVTNYDEEMVPSDKLGNVKEAYKAKFEEVKKNILEN